MENSTLGAKGLLLSLIGALFAYLHPISNEMQFLLVVFVGNFFAGLIADIVVNNKGFSFRKAWKCVKEATLFFALMCFIYVCGERKGEQEGALYCISVVNYAVLYYYGCNILRNIKLFLKTDTLPYKIFSFLYYIVSVEWIKKVPYLENYLEARKNEKKTPETIADPTSDS